MTTKPKVLKRSWKKSWNLKSLKEYEPWIYLCKHNWGCVHTIGSLSKGVFERRTSTGSEVFSLLTCLDDIKFVFLSFFTVIEAIWLKICAKPPSKKATSGSRAPARKPYRITLLFTRKVCDFGGISVTERSSDALISKVEHHIYRMGSVPHQRHYFV